jgi:hypothetical protein
MPTSCPREFLARMKMIVVSFPLRTASSLSRSACRAAHAGLLHQTQLGTDSLAVQAAIYWLLHAAGCEKRRAMPLATGLVLLLLLDMQLLWGWCGCCCYCYRTCSYFGAGAAAATVIGHAATVGLVQLLLLLSSDTQLLWGWCCCCCYCYRTCS